MSLHLAVAITTASLAVMTGCNRSTGTSMVGGGGSVSGDGWWFSSGSVFLQPNEPGVLFGMEKTPTGSRQFTYFVVFRHAEKIGDIERGKNSDLSYRGMTASLRDGLTINGKSFELALELETDKGAGAIQVRRFTINGVEVDPTRGNVLLVDFTSDAVTYKQVSATLPSGLPDPTNDSAVVAKLAREVTQTLKNENGSVKEFLKQ
jgi:hypothetical protein